jgi:hypothetical protein
MGGLDLQELGHGGRHARGDAAVRRYARLSLVRRVAHLRLVPSFFALPHVSHRSAPPLAYA